MNQENKKTLKIEKGVMVMKDGKAWGIMYDDGKSTCYGWIEPIFAPIHNENFCKNTTDVTYKDSHYIDDLKTAKLVKVERKTEVFLDFYE